MRKRASSTSIVSGLLAALVALGLVLPAVASATLSEVGLITKTEPETVPSCTTGPIGSVGKAMEEEKKKAEEGAKTKVAEEEKKKKEAEKKKREAEKKKTKATKKKAKKASVARSARLAGGTDAVAGGPRSSVTALAATTSTPAATTTETSTTATEAPCLAISRTTGFQTKVGTSENPLVIPHNGRIVAWTIDLGRPTAAQIKFFDENEGGVAEAGIAILAPEKTPALTYKQVAESKLVKIEPFFGLDAELPLEQTLKVKAGDVVALAVPTWAPALALGFGNTTAWRASREAKACSVTDTETIQVDGSKVTYSCQYLTARLAYSATLISTP